MIKSYTDIPQSQVLSKILSLESADRCYINGDSGKISIGEWGNNVHDEDDIPCWSLAALLDVLPNDIIMNKDSQSGKYQGSFTYMETYVTADNPVDTCYEMIILLHKLNLL